MTRSETRYERMDDIERKLARRPEGWTTGELAREFEVDADTIQRDLVLLQARGTGLIKQGRRYVLDHRRSFHSVKLSNDEALALYLAARLLSRHSDEHNPHVVKALEKLADALDVKSPLMAGHITRAADAVRIRRVRREYVEALEVLTQGWAEGRKVRLRYRSYTKDETTERTFAPYFIEPSGIGYACYVIGYDDLRKSMRTFKVERVYEAQITDERFARPDQFDAQQLLASAWGVIWRDEGEIEVTLRFTPGVVRRLKESVWHHSQRIEDVPDGSVPVHGSCRQHARDEALDSPVGRGCRGNRARWLAAGADRRGVRHGASLWAIDRRGNAMTNDESFLLQFWGKTPKQGDPPERYHPAIYHMLDVAFVAEALLRDGAPRLRRALLHAWDGCDPDALIAWLPFLIATHDLGKIAAAFQGQASNPASAEQRKRLIDIGVRFAYGSVELYHAEISAVWLHDHLAHRESGVPERLVWTLRDAMGGHHGRFTQAGMRDIRKRLLASERGEARWIVWRDATYTLLRRLLAPAGHLAALGAPRDPRPATAALTGFIVWCDWMGSNERDFLASPEMTIDQYMACGRERAVAALALHRLHANRPLPTYAGFSSLFRDPPRPLQELIDQLPVGELSGPLLTVIEAPTGEGKTEAALALARRIAAHSSIDEIFFALPTMATGNQMFTRLEKFYCALYGQGGAVRLTHSQSVALEADLRARVRLAGDSDLADRDGRSADAAIEWFVGPKKAMLAPFGVGTVDQIELAGLNVRHYALRLFGLAGKVVVIDEIHAYDAYMSTILAHTLTWLASLGCSVILLSATLPTERHRALATAFLSGLGHTAPPELSSEPPYPALSLYRGGGQRRETCAVFRGEQRFTLRFAPQRDPKTDAAYLLDLVHDGGAVARLCNRVDDAQAIYQALLDHLPLDSRVLLHARFPLMERQKREQRIEELLGKTTTRTAAQQLIIVGTQVLEQSLDYDVDVMISDFAPIDLLLQRAGRLHRHARGQQRPVRHAHPILEVPLPLHADGLPNWERWGAIYDAYILWRTWETLCMGMADDARDIVLPRDYRSLIETVYAEDVIDRTGASHAAAVAHARARSERVSGEQEAKARRPLTPDALSRDAITEAGTHTFIGDEDGQAASWQLAKTRLGDRVTVVPVYRAGDALALDLGGTWRISRDIPPDLDLQKEIIAHAVPISDRRIIAAYRDEGRARELRWPWSDIPPLLRSLYPLPLDRTHTTHCFADRSARLNVELGLVIEKLKPDRGLVIEEDL